MVSKIQQLDTKHVVSISNELSDANYRLSINEQRLVLAFISKIVNKPKDSEYQELNPLAEYRLSIDEFTAMFSISHKYANSILKETVDSLYNQSITITKNGKEGPSFRWIHYKDYSKETGEIVIKWTPDIIPLISLLTKDFNSYLLAAIAELQSWYSLRLFMLVNVRRRTKDKTVNYTVEQLRTILKLGDRYQTFGEFNKYILQPALQELNTKSDLRVVLTLNKHGKRVLGVSFTIVEIINMVEWRKQLAKEAEQLEKLNG